MRSLVNASTDGTGKARRVTRCQPKEDRKETLLLAGHFRESIRLVLLHMSTDVYDIQDYSRLNPFFLIYEIFSTNILIWL